MGITFGEAQRNLTDELVGCFQRHHELVRALWVPGLGMLALLGGTIPETIQLKEKMVVLVNQLKAGTTARDGQADYIMTVSDPDTNEILVHTRMVDGKLAGRGQGGLKERVQVCLKTRNDLEHTEFNAATTLGACSALRAHYKLDDEPTDGQDLDTINGVDGHISVDYLMSTDPSLENYLGFYRHLRQRQGQQTTELGSEMQVAEIDPDTTSS